MTIDDIANKAGVSKATVSRVLNGSLIVSESTKQKVQYFIDKYDYKPNSTARSLSNGDSKVIAVLVSEIGNEYFGRFLQGVSRAAYEKGYVIMSFNTDNDLEKERDILDTLRGQFLSGLLYTPSIFYKNAGDDLDIKSRIDKLSIPVILIDREMLECDFPGVYFDDKQAMYKSMRYFLERGHENIAVITGSFDGSLIRNRDQGVLQAAKEMGYEFRSENILRCDYTWEEAYRLTIERFQKGEFPTAFLLGNNKIGLGFIKALNSLGLELNHGVECIGIDKIESLDFVNYGYSYIERNSEKMGRLAIEMLLNQINSQKKITSVYMPANLVIKAQRDVGYKC